MKTKEELNELKQELETLSSKLQELTEDELKEITGGVLISDTTIEFRIKGLDNADRADKDIKQGGYANAA